MAERGLKIAKRESHTRKQLIINKIPSIQKKRSFEFILQNSSIFNN